MQTRNKPPAKYLRYPGMRIIYRAISRPLRTSTWLLYDPIKDKYLEKVRVYKKGGKSNE